MSLHWTKLFGREVPLAFAKQLAKEHVAWLRGHGYKACLPAWFKRPLTR
jgi:hypothetical protein